MASLKAKPLLKSLDLNKLWMFFEYLELLCLMPLVRLLVFEPFQGPKELLQKDSPLLKVYLEKFHPLRFSDNAALLAPEARLSAVPKLCSEAVYFS